MAVTSIRRISVDYSVDITDNFLLTTASNAASPASITIHTLVLGANTITLPTGGSTVVGATIIPPAENTQTLTLKGITGDTGIVLHKTDPISISFDTSPPVSFILTAGGTITGLKIIWT